MKIKSKEDARRIIEKVEGKKGYWKIAVAQNVDIKYHNGDWYLDGYQDMKPTPATKKIAIDMLWKYRHEYNDVNHPFGEYPEWEEYDAIGW